MSGIDLPRVRLTGLGKILKSPDVATESHFQEHWQGQEDSNLPQRCLGYSQGPVVMLSSWRDEMVMLLL